MKTFKEVINEGRVDETSVVKLDAVDKNIQTVIKKMESALSKAKVVNVFDGIHGIIAEFSRENYTTRLDKKDLDSIVKAGGKYLRWFEASNGRFSIGLKHR